MCIYRFNPTTYFVCAKQGPGFPTPHGMVFFFCSMRWEVVACFVDISWMFYHYCLNFLFIKYSKRETALSYFCFLWLIKSGILNKSSQDYCIMFFFRISISSWGNSSSIRWYHSSKMEVFKVQVCDGQTTDKHVYRTHL
jgi:hypothetical protein